MEIKYKNNGVEIVIKGIEKDNVLSDKEINSIVKIIELLKDDSISTQVNDIIKNNHVSAKIKKIKPSNKIDEDRPIIRSIVPNQVDLSELEIKKALTTEPMIRCPNCGQSSVVIVKVDKDKNYLMRKNYHTDSNKTPDFDVIIRLTDNEIENICKPEDSKHKDYYSDIVNIHQKKEFRGVDLNADNDTKLLCPFCKTENKFSHWVEAFNTPLNFGFETECLCDVCGGEAVKKMNKDKIFTIECEDKENCGFKRNDV